MANKNSIKKIGAPRPQEPQLYVPAPPDFRGTYDVYSVSVVNFQINRTRSPNTDTLYAGASLTFGSSKCDPVSKYVGDLGKGGPYNLDLTFPRYGLGPGEKLVLNYHLGNYGKKDKKQAIIDAIAKGLDVALTVIGEGEPWDSIVETLQSVASYVITACDGPVADYQVVYTKEEIDSLIGSGPILIGQPYGKLFRMVHGQEISTPPGLCPGESEYVVTYYVERTRVEPNPGGEQPPPHGGLPPVHPGPHPKPKKRKH